MNKPGRNEPCPCGSGRKYKHCCLPTQEVARPSRAGPGMEGHYWAELQPDLDEDADHFLCRLERGEGRGVGDDILAWYRKNPDYHMTNYTVGVYKAKVEEDAAGAIPYFERAVQTLPPFPEAYFNLGVAARKALQIAKSVEAFRMARRYSSGEDGIAEMAAEELDALERILVRTSPFRSIDEYVANARLFDQAFQCLGDGQFEQSIDLFKRVLAELPDHVQSYGNMGLAYAGLGRRSDAMACFDRALELDPGYEPAMDNRKVISRMREGEPFIAEFFREVRYYEDQVR